MSEVATEKVVADEPIDMARLTKIYRKIRDARDELKEEFNRKDRQLEEELSRVEYMLLEQMKEAGVEGIKNENGYVQRIVKRRFWSTDWESFKKFVVEHDALDLFEQRVSQRNMEQWLNENPDKLPAGLQVDSRYRVRVTKPREK